MKKIPCVFVRDFSDKRNPKITEAVTPGCEWVLNGDGAATRKRDGTACLVVSGQLFKRYDAKRGKEPPPGFVPAQDPDPVTGHWPGWIPVDLRNPDSGSVWHALAWHMAAGLTDGTYELCGPAINSNHERVDSYLFFPHGREVAAGSPRSFAGLREYLRDHNIEGIVFWREPGRVDGDMAKITRENFGFAWPVAAAE